MRGWIRKFTGQKQLTTQEKQEITAQQIERMISELFQNMKVVYVNGQKQIYNNPLGLTPEEVIAGFGERAPELFRLAMLLKDCLNIAVPGTIEEGDEYGTVVRLRRK